MIQSRLSGSGSMRGVRGQAFSVLTLVPERWELCPCSCHISKLHPATYFIVWAQLQCGHNFQPVGNCIREFSCKLPSPSATPHQLKAVPMLHLGGGEAMWKRCNGHHWKLPSPSTAPGSLAPAQEWTQEQTKPSSFVGCIQ